MKLADPGEIDLIKASGLFDEPSYLERYPDVKFLGMDPVEHYLWLGARLGRDPSPSFSTKGYVALNADVAASGHNPFVHYVMHGHKEGRVSALPTSLESTQRVEGIDRVAVFAAFSADHKVHDYQLIYLCALKSVASKIIVVFDNELPVDEQKKLNGVCDHLIATRHSEYDFGSYKRGIEVARSSGALHAANELILCNDSCYGPVGGFSKLFADMRTSDCNFWGLTRNTQFQPHIQSYFVVFKKPVFLDQAFFDFFGKVEIQPDVSKVVLTYEVPMTAYFGNLGYSWSTRLNEAAPEYGNLTRENPNLSVRPLYMIENGCPLIKVKALKKAGCNYDGFKEVLERVKQEDVHLHDAMVAHSKPEAYLDAANSTCFSIIMPFHNRKATLERAINSVLAQRHKHYELIAIDDGSTDGGSELIEQRYADEIRTGRIILVKTARGGVSKARNIGLQKAKYPWIAYLDSDNALKPAFLAAFADSMVDHPTYKTFYSYFESFTNPGRRGAPFDRTKLLAANFIDLGAFVHSKDLFEKLGGFDESLKRLVDWDLVIRYTEKNYPVCISRSLMVYDDNEVDNTRISVTESLDDARLAIRAKYKMPYHVTTIIPTYKHRDFIAKAIESALVQEGRIQHRILICDDGSDDGTADIVARYAANHPGVIRNISTPSNNGISKTFRRCIEAVDTADFIAVLEGDDVWTDNTKLEKQVSFLINHPECSMVFSKIEVCSLPSGARRTLERQENLKKNLLAGEDFLADPSMNLIANFSSCMFKAGLLRAAPKRLFEGRFNEIALAFHMERHGKIGFLNEILSVYHQHENGVWTGSTREQQLRSGIETREMVLDVAHPKYRGDIVKVIEDRYRKPLAELTT